MLLRNVTAIHNVPPSTSGTYRTKQIAVCKEMFLQVSAKVMVRNLCENNYLVFQPMASMQ